MLFTRPCLAQVKFCATSCQRQPKPNRAVASELRFRHFPGQTTGRPLRRLPNQEDARNLGFGYLTVATITISAILTVIMTLRAPKSGADDEPQPNHDSGSLTLA